MEATVRRSALMRPLAEGLSVPLALSAALHVVLLGGGILLYSMQPSEPSSTKPIVAKLVRLGKPRDPHLLPRKALPAVAPAAAAPVPLPGAPVRPPAPGAGPAASKPAPQLSREARMLQALARAQSGAKLEPAPAARPPEEAEGAADGDVRGDAANAEEGDRYLALVRRAVQDNYVLPSTIGDKERLYFKATVVVYVHPTGKILRYVIETSSGNDIFDRALERAIRKTVLPVPPPALAGAVREEGIGFIFQAQ